MQLITPTLDAYRKAHRVKQVGSYDGNQTKVIQQSFRNKAPAVGIPYYFNNDPDLNGPDCIITEIALISAAEQPILLAQSGNIITNVPDTAYPSGHFVAVDNKQEIICTIPFHNLNARLNGGKPCFVWLENQRWDNCYFLLDDVANYGTGNGLVWRITWIWRYLP